MDTWIFAETSVTVECRLYIFTVLLTSTILICGGLAIPFTVQERIRGVDPFQITTFSWLIVGSLLAIAKGRYVSEWPWHDFLHGRVVCRTVSDLADVTGVRPQTVLTKLLHNESKTTLITRGPYNGMFSRKADHSAPGFSIDVAVHLRTMLLSGFVIFKVLSDAGEHLIVLNARKGALSAHANESAVSARYLSCLDLGHGFMDTDATDVESSSAKSANYVLFLTSNFLRWKEVLGLYTCEAYFG